LIVALVERVNRAEAVRPTAPDQVMALGQIECLDGVVTQGVARVGSVNVRAERAPVAEGVEGLIDEIVIIGAFGIVLIGT
jgi:hypothetical protein